MIIYIASRGSPEKAVTTREPSSNSHMNGLLALFLLDRWMDNGADGLFGDADGPRDAPYDDEDDRRDDAVGEDQYWDDRAGF
ncbi:MAG: hypothetical protein EG825_16890 [Rhodocyclaceae bacterium]|nr:hypothetical protein [Rhodocyclaceae bacterium]